MAAFAILPFAGIASAHEADSKKQGQNGAGVEVNLASNGSVLVRGAKVTGVSGSSISATTNYGSSQLSWTVKTDGNTDFNANKGGATGLANIATGDTVSFSGSLDQAVSGLTVNAKVVKDWTQVESKKTLSGIVTSINATLDSFTVSHDNATTSVQTNGDTKFRMNGENSSFTSIFLNAKVKVAGVFNASSSILTATSVETASSTKKHDDFRGWFRGSFWSKFWNR
jgi:hypothetical protein